MSPGIGWHLGPFEVLIGLALVGVVIAVVVLAMRK